MDVDLPVRVLALADLAGHEDRAWHVAWNIRKPLLASCSADKTVRLYSYADNIFQHITTIPTGHTKTVRSVAWSPSGETIATASFDANIGVWEQEIEDSAEGQWECVCTLEGHETECKSVAYSCNGNYLASCSRDKTVWIWQGNEFIVSKIDVRPHSLVLPDGEFETISVLMEHTQDVKCVAWHPREEVCL
jgi:WD40 repeat protein